MERVTLREVFGIEGRSFNWGQVAMLVNAYLFSRFFYWYFILFPFKFGRDFPNLFGWLYQSAILLSFLILAVLLFRFISSIPLALVLSAVCHAPLHYVYHSVLSGVFGETDPLMEILGLQGMMIQGALYWIVPLGVLALALRFIKRLGVALIAGAIVGGLVYYAGWLHFIILAVPAVFDLRGIIGVVPQDALLGSLLWLGLYLTRKPPSTVGIGRISRPRFLGTLTATWGLYLYFGWIVLGSFSEQLQFGDVTSGGLVSVAVMGLLGICGVVVGCIFVHRMWASIQDGHARTSPGKAVGYLFIPIYDLYWIFQVFRGFSKDFNRLIARHSLAIKPLPVTLFTVFPVLFLLRAIPVVGLIILCTAYFVFLVLVSKTCDAINAVPETVVSLGA